MFNLLATNFAEKEFCRNRSIATSLVISCRDTEYRDIFVLFLSQYPILRHFSFQILAFA